MGTETQGSTRRRETKSDITPSPNRHVPSRTTSNGEGRWALWRPQGAWRQYRWPPGRCPFRDQAEQGVRAAMADQGTPWAIAGSPPKNVLGEVHNLEGALWWCGSLGCSGGADSRGCSGVLDGTSRGTGENLRGAGTGGHWRGETQEDAGEEPALESTGEEPALESTGEERPPGGIGEEPALGLGSNTSSHMPPTSPGAHEPL